MRRRGRDLYQPRARGRDRRERADVLVRVRQPAQGRGAQRGADRRVPDQPQADQREKEGGVSPLFIKEGDMRVFVAAVAGVAAVLVQPAAAQTPKLDDLPAALKPAGLSVYLEVPATGVQ